MDVGFNNTNTLHLALENEYLKDVEWIIEANSEEQRQIWKDYHEKMKWEEVRQGWMCTVLELEVKPKIKESKFISVLKTKKEVLPITINFNFAIVNGHKILFYTSDAYLVHHGYIEAFFSTYFQRTHDNYSRWNQTDAENIHNCLGYLEDIDEKPRKTVYKPMSHEKMYHIFKSIN